MSSLTSLRPGGGRLLTGLRGVLDPPLDTSLVDKPPRLLDALNRSDKLQKLLSKRDERGFTLLHIAAEKNQPESLKCLLIKEANPNVRSSVASDEITPLHVAAQCGHLACLQLLVQSGGDVMLPDRKQFTPIDHANIHGQDLCLNYLHEVVAKQQRDSTREVEDVLTEVERNLAADNLQTLNHWVQFNELFPLSIATGTANEISQADSIINRHCGLVNRQEMVRVLGRISRDVPICLQDATLLHAACHYGRLELATLLIEKVPKLILDLTMEGYNALHVAVAHRSLDVVRLLIRKQIQLNTHRHTGLHASSIEGSASHHEVSRSSRVPDRLGAPTRTGHTVLHFAVANNDRDTLSHLLKHLRDLQLGVDANECGYTPLHLAIFLNLSEVAHMLLRKAANANTRLDPTVQDKLASISRTPLSEAVLNKSPNCLNLLLEHGAEDKHHDALNFSLHQNPDVVVPLLGSLIKADDLHKPGYKQSHKDRRMKTAAIDWSHLKLSSLPPHWIASSLPSSMFLRLQNIERSRLSEFVTSINLSHNTLAWLPAEVFTLPNLTLLNASHNHLERLPEIDLIYDEKDNSYRWPCVALSKLVISRNWLISLPEFIFSLASLTHLDLSYNRLEKLPFDLWKAPKLHHLNCSHNELLSIPTNWPRVLDECVCITSPSPNHAPATPTANHTTPPLLTKSPSITKLPPMKENKPSKSDSDKKEDSENTPISKLQDRLNICNGNLPVEWDASDPREEVYEGLAILDLSNNQLSAIPENLPCLCPKLVRLDLSHNDIETISLPRNFPVSIKHLNLSHNPIVELNSQQTLAIPLPCTNPQVLYDANNSIIIDNTSFCTHRSHNQMRALGVLELNNCQLEFVNLFTTQQASSKKADAKKQTKSGADAAEPPQVQPSGPAPPSSSSSSSSKRPQGSSHSLARLVCPLLTRLILSHNQLTEVPMSVCEIISLNSLDLSHNQIIELPAELGNLCNLWEFPLTELKLISPPQNIIDRGKTKDIIGFLWSLLQRARPYHRMKLMLVGKAARGKTTLLERISDRGQRGRSRDWGTLRMLNPVYRPAPSSKEKKLSTVGIVVSDWTYYKKVKESQTSLKSITFMTWDFGGQEEYYATHQCFLSRRSLYLVVWNTSHGMVGVEELKPWLLNIQARAPHSPVIIVGTHLDKVSSRLQKQELQRCLDYINNSYGSEELRKEGFPQVMRNVVVSCKPGTSGSRLQELRDAIFDVASQVKENIVAGRGIGNGRIPEYRLLMDQLVPASYLQLEDTIRNLALNMRLAERPPVLTYKELRDAVFADPRTLISKQNSSRELEQAVRFLHDNGTMLHYEDPLLTDLYFVDPQWLCDMLAHIVTVREINPLVKDGVMRLKDFPLIFNDQEFPIRWQIEYIRLLTMFEVAVELGKGELLVPSALPQAKPNLPQSMIPDDMRRLPELRHTYIVPFIPSGFWPRLMSRLLTDGTLLHLAREGCGLREEDADQLSWVKWRTGLILQYGNLTLLSIEELRKGMFPKATRLEGIKIFKDEQWKLHHKSVHIFGIDIVVPDIYPILKYPEAAAKRRRKAKEQLVARRREPNPPPPPNSPHPQATPPIPTGRGVASRLPVPEITVESSQESAHSGESQLPLLSSSSESHDSLDSSHDALQPVLDGCAHKVVSMDQIDSEFEKLARMRTRTHGNSRTQISTFPDEGVSEVGGASNLLLGNTLHRSSPSLGRRSRANSLESNQTQPVAPPPSSEPAGVFPGVEEERSDMMRAGLLSKSVDHISLLIEEWFTGVRPRTLVVPCPHCTADAPHSEVRLQRSFSNIPTLLSEEEHGERGTLLDSTHSQAWSERLQPVEERLSVLQGSSAHLRSPRTGRPIGNHDTGTERGRQNGSMELSQEPYYYAFQYNDCVVTARTQNNMFCPAHGNVQLQYTAPDTLFLTQGKDVLLNPQDLEREESIGKGAYATVFKARLKKPSDDVDGDVQYVALKALTKEWRIHDAAALGSHGGESAAVKDSASCGNGETQLSLLKPPSRHSIIEGFTNLKKELSILSPLKHTHVIRLFGIMLRPLGLVLELAPRGSLKDILQTYAEAMRKPNGSVIQAVVVQVAKAIQYLHRCSIIYRDLKSTNVLVWAFPEPEDVVPTRTQLGLDTVFVKLSDYGISQFAATQGARGLLGTPGFMAPEILKYHGKEVYTDSVDIFSFGMFIYELMTLRIPYESLTAQQANLANERGSRPPLTRKDFPCPVLLRELMVWCWQQSPERRPTAGEIIAGAQSEQFLRLLEGIRVNESGQVTAMCVRVNYASGPRTHSRSHLFSPPPPHSSTPSLTNKSPITSLDTQGSHDASPSHVTSGRSPVLPCVSEENGATDKQTRDSGITTFDPSRIHSNERKISHDRGRRSFSSNYSADEPRLKSPRFSMEPMSLGGYFDDDIGPTYEFWIASSDAHHCTAAVMEYNGHFLSLEDVEVGDSPVLAMCAVRDRVWMAFEIGCLVVYDAATHEPLVQAWVRQHTRLLCMTHLSALSRVYMGLEDGSVLGFPDDLSHLAHSSSRVTLEPVVAYQDVTQTAASLLVVPSPRGDGAHEIWVGQKSAMITVLEAETLWVVKFIQNKLDLSKVPSYVAYLSYAHLVLGAMSPDSHVMPSRPAQLSSGASAVSVYGAMYHGQYVTRWNADSKIAVESFNCQTFLGKEECAITSLHYSRSQLYVGLQSGRILVMDPLSCACVCELDCHRSRVSQLTTLSLNALQQTEERCFLFHSTSSGPSPILPEEIHRSPSLSSVQSDLLPIGHQLFSVGSGFSSYCMQGGGGAEAKRRHHREAGFLLVWEAESWTEEELCAL